MRNFFLAFAVLFVVLSCDEVAKTEIVSSAGKTYSIVSGRIENTKAERLLLSNEYYDGYYGNNNGQFVKIDPQTGAFRDTIWGKGEYYVWEENTRNFLLLYLFEGKELQFSYDSEKLSGVSDEGKSGEITLFGYGEKYNRYKLDFAFLSHAEEQRRKLEDFKKPYYLLSEEDFLRKLDSSSNGKKIFFDTHKDEIPPEMVTFEEKYLNDFATYKRLSYIKNRSYVIPDFEPTVEVLKNDLQINYDLNDPELFQTSTLYRNCVKSIVTSLAAQAHKKDSLANKLDTYLYVLDSKVSNPIIKENLLYESVKSDLDLNVGNSEKLNETYQKYTAVGKDENYKNKIKVIYDKSSLLVKGAPAPQFNYEDTKGAKLALSDFKGKYVFIDVWATWCGPCRSQVPNLKKLEEEYGKKISFLSVSIDSQKDKDKWKKMILDEDLRGTHLIAEGEWQSSIVSDYMIRGIPRFMLIDPEGKIVEIEMPQPSIRLEEIKKIFDGLI